MNPTTFKFSAEDRNKLDSYMINHGIKKAVINQTQGYAQSPDGKQLPARIYTLTPLESSSSSTEIKDDWKKSIHKLNTEILQLRDEMNALLADINKLIGEYKDEETKNSLKGAGAKVTECANSITNASTSINNAINDVDQVIGKLPQSKEKDILVNRMVSIGYRLQALGTFKGETAPVLKATTDQTKDASVDEKPGVEDSKSEDQDLISLKDEGLNLVDLDECNPENKIDNSKSAESKKKKGVDKKSKDSRKKKRSSSEKTSQNVKKIEVKKIDDNSSTKIKNNYKGEKYKTEFPSAQPSPRLGGSGLNFWEELY